MAKEGEAHRGGEVTSHPLHQRSPPDRGRFISRPAAGETLLCKQGPQGSPGTVNTANYGSELVDWLIHRSSVQIVWFQLLKCAELLISQLRISVMSRFLWTVRPNGTPGDIIPLPCNISVFWHFVERILRRAAALLNRAGGFEDLYWCFTSDKCLVFGLERTAACRDMLSKAANCRTCNSWVNSMLPTLF